MHDRIQHRAGYELCYSSTMGEGTADPAHGPSAARRTKLDACVIQSRRWVSDGYTTAQGWADNGVANATHKVILRKHMRLRGSDFDAGSKHLKRIATVLFAMKWGMACPNLRISDVAGRGGGGTEGYVKFLTQRRLFHRNEVTTKSIHVEFSYADTYSDRALSRVIVHEASHKFADTEDYAYHHEPAYDGLPRRKTTDNADSYAYLLMSLAEDTVLTFQLLDMRNEH